MEYDIEHGRTIGNNLVQSIRRGDSIRNSIYLIAFAGRKFPRRYLPLNFQSSISLTSPRDVAHSAAPSRQLHLLQTRIYIPLDRWLHFAKRKRRRLAIVWKVIYTRIREWE